MRYSILIFFVLLPLLGCHTRYKDEIETYTVKRGNFISAVTETGELEAVNSETITAPNISWRFGTMKITKIVDDGTQVKKGDVVVEFDIAEVQKGIDDAIAELEIAKAEYRKAKATNNSKIEELSFELEKSKIQYEISKLKLEQAVFEAEIDRKKIELDLEKAAINLDKAEQEIENQKSINNEEESKLDLKVTQVQAKLAEARETLEKFTVKASADGIAIIKKSWITREKYQIDDQVWSGWPLIGLPDLSTMQAKAQINEVDIAKIDTAQAAKISLDAYPDSSYKATVVDISSLARSKEKNSKVKVFDVIVLLSDNNPKLMPGMTVSCEITINTIQDTIFIPLEALFHKEGANIVYLRQGDKFKAQNVKIGFENDDFVLITEGLKKDDKIALTDPTLLQDRGKSIKKQNGSQKT